MADWVKACKLADIEAEGVVRFDHGGRTFAVYRSAQDEVFCTDGLCTHEAVHLAEGLVMDYEIECPKHSGTFDYRTGEALRMPPCINLRTYEAQTDGETVRILLKPVSICDQELRGGRECTTRWNFYSTIREMEYLHYFWRVTG